MKNNMPHKKQIDDYPPGTVIITKPADPEKLEAYHKEQAQIMKRSPNYRKQQPRFGDQPIRKTFMSRNIYHIY